MKVSPLPIAVLTILSLILPACNHREEEHHHEAHKILATSPETKSVTITQQYVCQIHSQRHIEIRALERGYLEAIPIKEGQFVKAGESMFRILPVLYQTKLDAELAEAQLAQLEYNNTKKLAEDKVVSQNELLLLEAKLKKAKAKAALAAAELSFTDVKAPYDGIADRVHHQQGSLVEEGDVLTTLSDNSVMWVYFNVPEARYLEYKAGVEHQSQDVLVQLKLANGQTFPHVGKIGAIEADFDNETGNIPFRADFPNPDGLLRHGQTGTVLLNRVLDNAIVIPQRATFEILDKQYVYVIEHVHADAAAKHADDDQAKHGDHDDDDDDEKDEQKDGDHQDGEHHEHEAHEGGCIVHQRQIVVEHELDDIYVIKEGLSKDDQIVLEGVRQVRDGDRVDCEYVSPEEVLSHLKYHAE